jgi:mannosyltransferase
MASGNALVAARAGAAEAVVTGGKVALLVAPGDPGALAAALEPLMRDPQLAADMGARARDYVATHFSIESEAEKIVAVYRPLLGAASTRSMNVRRLPPENK